jgi:hypothetical protein
VPHNSRISFLLAFCVLALLLAVGRVVLGHRIDLEAEQDDQPAQHDERRQHHFTDPVARANPVLDLPAEHKHREQHAQRNGDQLYRKEATRLLHVVGDVQLLHHRVHGGGGRPQGADETKESSSPYS